MEPKIGIRRRVSRMVPLAAPAAATASDQSPPTTKKKPVTPFERTQQPVGPGFGGGPGGIATSFPMLGD